MDNVISLAQPRECLVTRAAIARDQRRVQGKAERLQRALAGIYLSIADLPARERLFILNHALAEELGPAGVIAIEP